MLDWSKTQEKFLQTFPKASDNDLGEDTKNGKLPEDGLLA